MKAYGQKRTESPGRNIRGTSRPCPCCQRVNPNCKKTKRAIKKRARQQPNYLHIEDYCDLED